MCAEIRKMGSRFWELHSHDTIFFVGGIITVAAALLSLPAGIIVGYFWLDISVLLVWDKELAPFDRIESDRIKWALVLLGPLTFIGIMVGICVYVAGCPFFVWHDAQKNYKRRLRQIAEDEEDNEYAVPTPPRLRVWLISGALYYSGLATALVAIWLVISSN